MIETSAVEDFYRAVAKLLHCEAHGYQPFPFRRRSRWNNRNPGSGRFPGHGLVRFYGPAHIHVHLNDVVGVFASIDAALAAIRAAQDAADRAQVPDEPSSRIPQRR